MKLSEQTLDALAIDAVMDVFSIMFQQIVCIIGTSHNSDVSSLLCKIDLVGKLSGNLHLNIPNTLANRLCAILLEDNPTPDMVFDFTGELGNILAGNFKNRLCDKGHNCNLSTLVTTRNEMPALDSASAGYQKSFYFQIRDDIFSFNLDIANNPQNPHRR